MKTQVLVERLPGSSLWRLIFTHPANGQRKVLHLLGLTKWTRHATTRALDMLVDEQGLTRSDIQFNLVKE